jgi:hypothetical protein
VLQHAKDHHELLLFRLAYTMSPMYLDLSRGIMGDPEIGGRPPEIHYRRLVILGWQLGEGNFQPWMI